jgi:rSAM/selenodomain-associated transferase 1
LADARHSVAAAATKREAVLGVFAKRPAPGAVKTRLAAETSPNWSALVADAFLRDTLARFRDLPVRRVVAFAPASEREFFAAVAGDQFELARQADGDLGRRLETFMRQQLDRGARRIVVVGTDSPTLPEEYVAEAFRLLNETDVVVGPATDGGYYLLGCAARLPPAFDGIDWGGPTVLADTLARIPSDWQLGLLPPWYDVDTLADWHFLRGHLAAIRRAGQVLQVPATERLLANLSLG